MSKAKPPAAEIEALRARAAEHDWYHCLELAPGVVTEGMFDLRPYVDRYGLPEDLTGKRVLDVGTFDGFWAFELERRGAEVVAIDVDRVQQLDWPVHLRPSTDAERGERFRIAHAALGSGVERVGLSVYEATPERLGRFDLVFCGSILIHLRDPIGALERMAALARDRFVMAEGYSRRLERLGRRPAAEFLGEEPHMTWWLPTTRAWMAMAQVAGFGEVRHHGRFKLRFRGRRGGVPHTVIHARGAAAAGD